MVAVIGMVLAVTVPIITVKIIAIVTAIIPSFMVVMIVVPITAGSAKQNNCSK